MAPGEGFFLIVREPGPPLGTGSGTTVRTDSAFAISLPPGWSLLGNPFNFSIPRSNLRLESTGQSPELRFYDGAWSNPAAEVLELERFEGYAVFNALPRGDTLFIDPDLSAPPGGSARKAAARSDDGLDWSIRILAQSRQARDVDNVAAVAASASETWDPLDAAEPPLVGAYVSVYFPHPEWHNNTARYSTDTRPVPTDGAVWPVAVTTALRDPVRLRFEGLDEVPPAFEVWLVDDFLQITQDLRKTNRYTVAGAGDGVPRLLRLVVGTQAFVEHELQESREIPTRFDLFPNFPNPFNPTTTLRYGLPVAERVSLVIYNVLGEKVATLEAEAQKEAGYHAVVWDGRSDAGTPVASGVYFVRMRAGAFVQTRQMVLVK